MEHDFSINQVQMINTVETCYSKYSGHRLNQPPWASGKRLH